MIVALPGLFSYLFCFSFAWCYFVLVFFSPLSVGIASLGEERANLSGFRMFGSICVYLDLSLSSSSWCLGGGSLGVLLWYSLDFSLTCFYLMTIPKIKSQTSRGITRRTYENK